MAARKRRQYQPVEELDVDPSPLYWVDVSGDGTVTHNMAFDPQYGPDTEDQLDYWRSRGYPGSDAWEIGKAVTTVNPRTAETAMMAARER